MSKPLLLAVMLVLGIMVVALLGQAGMHQVQLQTLYLQTDLLQQQNYTLAARQELLNRENEKLASQNQQMQQHLTSLQAAYQQARAQNRRLQAVVDVAGQLETVSWSLIFWLGSSITTTVVLAAFVVARRIIRTPNHSSGDQPESPAVDTPWDSQGYRLQAIQKARQIERWERQSVLAHWDPQRIPMPIDQKSITTIQR